MTSNPALASAVVRTGRLVRCLAVLAILAASVAGLPWALWHFIGWPLPDHVPAWDELWDTLVLLWYAGPTQRQVLAALAVVCWIVWAVLVIDLLRAVPETIAYARHQAHQLPARSGPVYGVAALLLSTGIVPLLGFRMPSGAAAAASGQGIVATNAHTRTSTGTEQPVTAPATHRATPAEPDSRSDGPHAVPRTVVVREPHDGIHDSLWRIAQRELADGTRWPEIYRLNKGGPQSDGERLTNPNLIYPGWTLRLPDQRPLPPETKRIPPSDLGQRGTGKPDDSKTRPTPQSTTQHTTRPSTAPSTTAPHTNAPDTNAPGTPTASSVPRHRVIDRGGKTAGIDLRTGVFVGLGLAAAVSAALVAVRRRNHVRYVPGSGRRDDLYTPPIVRSLHLQHIRAIATDAEGTSASGKQVNAGPPEESRPTPIGVRDGHELLLDLAKTHGLGLIGPGAKDAASALLLTLLTSPSPEARRHEVLVPRADLATLFQEPENDDHQAPGLHVVADLKAALDRLEAEILHRARLAAGEERGGSDSDVAPMRLVLLATPPTSTRRLQAILDNGASVGIIGVLLGQWRAGGTAYVQADGTVSSTSPGWAAAMRDARLFTAPAPEASDLLALFDDACKPGFAGEKSSRPAKTQEAPVADPHSEVAGEPEHATLSVREAEASPSPLGDGTDVPFRLTVFGKLHLRWQASGNWRDVDPTLSPRQREVLLFLALHPNGVHRDTLIGTLWPDSPRRRPGNGLHTALSKLRHTLADATTNDLADDLVVRREDHYQLNPDLTEVDFWTFSQALVDARTAADDAARADAYSRACAAYTGSLGQGMDTDWVEGPREAARREAVDAISWLARHTEGEDPQRALGLLETARALDPHNESVYRDIMRIQSRLGHPGSVQRTLALLTTRLAELDIEPSQETVQLAQELQQTQAT